VLGVFGWGGGVVSFKRDVYRRVMKEFAPFAMPFNKREQHKDHWRSKR